MENKKIMKILLLFLIILGIEFIVIFARAAENEGEGNHKVGDNQWFSAWQVNNVLPITTGFLTEVKKGPLMIGNYGNGNVILHSGGCIVFDGNISSNCFPNSAIWGEKKILYDKDSGLKFLFSSTNGEEKGFIIEKEGKVLIKERQNFSKVKMCKLNIDYSTEYVFGELPDDEKQNIAYDCSYADYCDWLNNTWKDAQSIPLFSNDKTLPEAGEGSKYIGFVKKGWHYSAEDLVKIYYYKAYMECENKEVLDQQKKLNVRGDVYLNNFKISPIVGGEMCGIYIQNKGGIPCDGIVPFDNCPKGYTLVRWGKDVMGGDDIRTCFKGSFKVSDLKK